MPRAVDYHIQQCVKHRAYARVCIRYILLSRVVERVRASRKYNVARGKSCVRKIRALSFPRLEKSWVGGSNCSARFHPGREERAFIIEALRAIARRSAKNVENRKERIKRKGLKRHSASNHRAASRARSARSRTDKLAI